MEHGTRSLGLRIKSARRARGLTAAELALRAGITENAVRKIESGDSKEPRFSTGLRIAAVLGVGPDFHSGRRAGQSAAVGPQLATVIRQIRGIREALAKRGVAHVRIFGSVARGDAGQGSDVDAIIGPLDVSRFTLFDLAATRDILSQAVGCRVDVFTNRTIEHSDFAEAAEQEAVSVF